jgi:7-keto-8-aminopelargonate synthetase-like enzyme
LFKIKDRGVETKIKKLSFNRYDKSISSFAKIIVKRDKWRRVKCWENAKYLKNKLEEAGFNTLKSQTPIIPVLIGDEKKAIDISKDLFKQGVLAPPFRWPAVPKGQALMRFTVTCEYTKEQLDMLVENLIIVSKKYKIIK